MKLPRLLEIIVYLLLSLFLTPINFFVLVFTCGGIDSPNCSWLIFLILFNTLIFLQSILIAFLTKRKLSAFLGTLVWPIWILQLLSIHFMTAQLTLISVLVGSIGALFGFHLNRYRKNSTKLL